MPESFESRIALSGTGLLAELNKSGRVDAGEVQLARRLAGVVAEDDQRATAVVALVLRSLREGSVAMSPHEVDPAWVEALLGSRLVADGAVVLDHDLLYLRRYRDLEIEVARDLERLRSAPVEVDESRLGAALDRVAGDRFSEEQRQAAVHAVRRPVTVLTGGPGTGKTTTVARILALVADQVGEQRTGPTKRPVRIALAAPTGKAAARLAEAIEEEVAAFAPLDRERIGTPEPTTLHRLLGWRAESRTRFRRHRANPLAFDVIVVDECSMVDLEMMAALVAATRSGTRLVLSGDPQQLASVGAGAVLSDIVDGWRDEPDSPVVSLKVNHRSQADIRELAEAVRIGDTEAVLTRLATPSGEIAVARDVGGLRDVMVPRARRVVELAHAGDLDATIAALGEHRLLCAHRHGQFGVSHWNRQVEAWLAADGVEVSGWYAGRPLLVTRNDPGLDVYNGEVGVVLVEQGRPRAWIQGGGRARSFAATRLESVETMHALTIHKSQGSQADEVTVLLPDQDSRLLTRELFYTALTRARRFVRVVGSQEAVRRAVETRASRATGLSRRLGSGGAEGRSIS